MLTKRFNYLPQFFFISHDLPPMLKFYNRGILVVKG
jgi:hypothetical protein